MQSDILPFTAYDSMGYVSVNDMGPPAGFQRRDAPAVQSRQAQSPEMMPMQNAPAQGGGNGVQGASGGTPVAQGPKEDISLDAYDDLMSVRKNDIGNYKNMKDLLYIFLAILAVDVAVIFLTRFFPEIFGQQLNRWYDMFSLNAVIADVGIIFVGFLIARYIYTGYVKDKFAEGKWSPLWFTATLVGTQLIHDLAFYFGIIKQIPRGHNVMMDVFKDYSESGGAKILFGDALMCIGSVAGAVILKQQPMHAVAAFGSLVAYALPYILYTRNQFSVLK
jgi:hypothetical protein